jgi:hypothetical protein
MYWRGYPRRSRIRLKKAMHRIFYAACLDDARDETRQFLSHYQREFLSAAETLAGDTLRNALLSIVSLSVTGNISASVTSLNESSRRLRERPWWLDVSQMRLQLW